MAAEHLVDWLGEVGLGEEEGEDAARLAEHVLVLEDGVEGVDENELGPVT